METRKMISHNSENERIKRRSFAFLREAKRLDEDSIDTAAAAIHQFEMYTRFKDFRAFHIEQAIVRIPIDPAQHSDLMPPTVPR
jgi:hypothetical protein